MTIEALSAGRSLAGATEAIRATVDELLAKMEAAEETTGSIRNADWHLQLAKGYMAGREWAKAASHFDHYCYLNPLDSEVQFSRGVAHANVRGGRLSDLNSLRAYNEAIALAPEDLDRNFRARYFAYRGAMLKRLRRLDEAEADLQLAMGLANRSLEVNDIRYNLAGVYAIQGDREKLMGMVSLLCDCPVQLRGIRYHLDDYFKRFAQDKEFLQAIGAAE